MIEIVTIVGALLDLVLFGLLVLWMVRIIAALERIARATERTASANATRPQMPGPAQPPTPTQSVFG